MSLPEFQYTKNEYDLFLPNKDDFILHLKIESPVFSGVNGADKINRFYEKKLKRTVSYYTKSSLAALKKAKRRGKDCSDLFPNDITVSFKVTDSSNDYISLLRKTELKYSNAVYNVYASENWRTSSASLLFLGDLIYIDFKRESQLIKYILDKCEKDRYTKFNPNLKRRIRRNLYRENIYYKDGNLYLFFQEGTIAQKEYGLISIPLIEFEKEAVDTAYAPTPAENSEN